MLFYFIECILFMSSFTWLSIVNSSIMHEKWIVNSSLASSHCGSYDLSVIQCRDPYYSHWWGHLSSVLWTTVMPHSSASLNIFCNGSSVWWTQPHDSPTQHWGSATSLRSSNDFTGWKRRSGLPSRSLFLCINVNTELLHLTSPMSSVVRRTCKVAVVFVLCHYHYWPLHRSMSLSLLAAPPFYVTITTGRSTPGDRSFIHGCQPLSLEQLAAACHIRFFAVSLQKSS